MILAMLALTRKGNALYAMWERAVQRGPGLRIRFDVTAEI